jgi:hypothetical protein
MSNTIRELEFVDTVDSPSDHFELTITRQVGNASVSWTGDVDVAAPTERDVPPVPGQRRPWWPAAVDTMTDWCKSRDVVEEAERRLGQVGSGVTERAVCAELFLMWREAGRTGGSADSMRKIRSRQS